MILLLLATLATGAAQDQDRVVFTSRESNFRVSYPFPWTAAPAPAEAFLLTLTHNGNLIGVIAGETSSTLDAVIDAIEEDRKLNVDRYTKLSREDTKVAGEPAIRLVGDVRTQGISMRFYAVVFAHQGIVYRVIGGHATGDRDAFERDFQEVLASFKFLRERTEWLEKYQGKPARTALLGGLMGFELNRPRWTENTFASEREWAYLEQADFGFIGGGAWISLRVRESSSTGAEDLESLRHMLATRLTNPHTTDATFKSRGGEIRGIDISGEYNKKRYFFLATVLREEGLSAFTWMEGEEVQRSVVREDWEKYLQAFRLDPRSKPPAPLAYPIATRETRSPADPALAAVLGMGYRLGSEGTRIAALAPDGAQAIVVQQGAALHVNLLTGRRETLPIEISLSAHVSWSDDGERILIADAQAAALVTLDTGKVQRFDLKADDAVFGGVDGQWIVCAVTGERTGEELFQANRLETFVPATKARKVLLEYPLSRFSRPAVSPDRKRIAFEANRDYPRTATLGGHLYVLRPDGTEIRQLTRGPEALTCIHWSSDGEWIYATRRLSVGVDGAVGPGGLSDLYRYSAATGKELNLTRSGHIGDFWLMGGDVVIQTEGWDLPASQRGIFRIPLEELEKATASRPLPKVPDPRAAGTATTREIARVLGETPIKDLIPTPELMEKIARVFAESATQATGRRFDFSEESLDQLQRALPELGFGVSSEPALALGVGAYYGETLRRVAGAEWKFKGSPFGDWIPSEARQGNSIVEPIFPFSDAWGWAQDQESDTYAFLGKSALRRRDPGRRLLLVHPPSYVAEAVREATPVPYLEARRILDAGELRAALDLLLHELESRPRNRDLAREVISLCRSAGLENEARDLTRRAVEAGSEVPDLIVRLADDIKDRDPKKALTLYRRAAEVSSWPQAEILLKLGHAYASGGDRAVAESCWRHAHASANPAQKAEIVRLLASKPFSRE
jgi:hypothetical protein